MSPREISTRVLISAVSEQNVPAVLCSKCATDLPEGAQFCLKCGEPVRTPADEAAPAIAVLACSKCGTSLPEGAEFCPRCGKPVSVPKRLPKEAGSINFSPIDSTPIGPTPAPTSKLGATTRVVLLTLAGVLMVVAVWMSTSDNPFAQGIQEVVGSKHDQTIVDSPFAVSAHNFRYYKFALPEGSTRVAIMGQFTVSADNHSHGQSENNIEVYVLSEPAFAVWQNGYAADSVYESGRVSSGSLGAELPTGAGIYYLVFNNKFAPKAAKNINASVLLRYKNWLPESLRRAKDRFWNWIGV